MQELSKIMAAKTSSENSALWLPLWMHLRDTADIMKKLAEEWVPDSAVSAAGLGREEFCKIAVWLAAVHDIGKCTALFQSRITEMLPEIREMIEKSVELRAANSFMDSVASPHALAGEAILLEFGVNRGTASIVGSHHGKPPERPKNGGTKLTNQIEVYKRNYFSSSEYKEQWRDCWKDYFSEALELAGYESAEEIPKIELKAAQVLLCGLLITADWIASNPNYFPLINIESTGSEELYEHRAENAWKKLRYMENWRPQYCFMDEDIFEERFGFAPNAVQKKVLEIANNCKKPGIMIIEAQMGVGKTEAALAAAEVIGCNSGCGGLFFGLPTQATANGIFKRIKSWGEAQAEETNADISVRLAHGLAELNEDYREIFDGCSDADGDDPEGKLIVNNWFKGKKQALLASFVTGTVDQFLLAGLKRKHVMLRHLGLASKVVIIDECHAYDAYMSTYLDRVMEWMGAYRVPVIILSATLPTKRRSELVDTYNGGETANDEEWRSTRKYPLITWTDGGEVKQDSVEINTPDTVVRTEKIVYDDIAKRVEHAVKCGGCTGVIVNTVKKAQSIAKMLAEKVPDAKIMVFHAQFVMPDRIALEQEIMRLVGKNSDRKSREKLVIVGTQVMEQSLDMDFDLMITELCPMDLLLQRMGRLHRHKRERPAGLEEAVCCVLTEKDEFDGGSKAIYTKWMLMQTEKLLPEKVLIPSDIPTLVQSAYEDGGDTCKEKEEFDLKIKCKKINAKGFLLDEPQKISKLASKNNLEGWLDDTPKMDEGHAEASVRDGDGSVDVLAMVVRADGSVHFLPWQCGGAAVAANAVPSKDEAIAILRQRLRLPSFFSKRWNIDSTINELEKMNAERLAEWQNSPYLKGELVLLFDESLSAKIGSTTLKYDKNIGLTYERENDNEG